MRVFELSMGSLEHHSWMAAVYALVIYAFAIVGSRLQLIGVPFSEPTARYGTLDGLRGLLAVGVMIHHSHAAYFYHTEGVWAWSDSSPILNQLGQSTVAIFFMITGFLFSIKAMKPRMNWAQFFLGRFVRLAPLYFLVVGIVVSIVLMESDMKLQVSLRDFLIQVAQWLAFVCFGRPDINLYPGTWTLIAGVNWSLKLEVMFYLIGVPLLHIGYRRLNASKMLIIIFTLFAGFILYRWLRQLQFGTTLCITQFLAGIIVAHLHRAVDWTRKSHRSILIALTVCAICVLSIKLNAQDVVAIYCAAILLLASVIGVSVFGLMRWRAIVWLGDISYGIYLLHGLVLAGVLHGLSRWVDLRTIGVLHYLGVMFAVAGLVTALASLSFRHIELPTMRWAARRRSKGTPTAGIAI